MAMSGVSNSNPLALRKDHDSVENEKEDFAPPIKKLKVVGEEQEHNTDSVTSLSDRQIFDKWCKCYRKVYKDEDERENRFRIFQKALQPPTPEEERGWYYLGLADRTEQELRGRKACVFESDIKALDFLDEMFTKSEVVHGYSLKPFSQTQTETQGGSTPEGCMDTEDDPYYKFYHWR